MCFGHRGARGHEPENTLLSIRRALEMGANGIEVDVWNAGGRLMVIHDAKLQRTTNGKGYVWAKSFEELRALDAGKGERVPTLEEVFELVDGRATVNVELKGRVTAGLVSKMIEEGVRKNRWDYRQFIVSSFHRRELASIANPEIPIGMLCARPTPFYHLSARRLRALSIHSALAQTTRRFVRDAHRRGYKVFVYTVNSPADIQRMRDWEVDGVFTDFPDRVCAPKPTPVESPAPSTPSDAGVNPPGF